MNNELPGVGTHRDVLDKESIAATTFHPFKDIWWVVWKNPVAFITIENKVVTKAKEMKSIKKAFKKMQEKAGAAYAGVMVDLKKAIKKGEKKR